MLKPLFEEALMLIEVAIKKVVRADLAAASRLQKIEGNVLCVELTSPSIVFYVTAVVDGVEFSFQEQEAHCTLRGSWIDFLEIAEDEQRLFGAKVSIQGDHHWLVELKSILTSLDIDWEGLLANYLGDIPAYQIGQCFRSTKSYAKHTSALLCDDLSDYIHEELRLLPAKPELDYFYHSVDDLRLRVDRLNARVSLLRGAVSADNQSEP